MAETYGRFLQEHRACLTPPCQAVPAPSTSGGIGSPFILLPCYPISVAKWVTVTVTDPDGRRHSLDVQASTFDAAHLYVAEAKRERAVGMPKPSNGHRVRGGDRRQGVPRQRRGPPALDRRAAAERAGDLDGPLHKERARILALDYTDFR